MSENLELYIGSSNKKSTFGKQVVVFKVYMDQLWNNALCLYKGEIIYVRLHFSLSAVILGFCDSQ